MDSLALRLQPISKLKIYTAIRSIVLKKMGNDEISPERAMKIIEETKTGIIQLKTAPSALHFCREISQKYAELKGLMTILEQERLEQYDQVLSKMSEQFMEKNDLSRVDEILDRMEECTTQKKKEALLKEMQAAYPEEFRSAVDAVLQSNQ